MDSNEINASTGTGYLVVQVTTASNAIPLEGAQVTVRRADGNGQVLYERRSGRDGRTARMALPAPLRTASLRPSAALPYGIYGIEVFLPGYERAFYASVPIFDGITALQQANLLPLPENGYPDGFTLNGGQQFEGGVHHLQGGEG